MNRKLNLANVILSVLIGLTLLFSAVQPVSVSASDSFIQDGIRRGYHPQTGKLSFLGADPSNPLRVEKAMERGLAPETRAVANLEMYAREFGIRDVSRELRVMRSTNAEDRLTVKYQQVYKDIPVMAGELIVNMKGNGGLLSINGEVSPDLRLDTQPKLSREEARQRALVIVSQTYDLAEAELTVSEPELWIFDERLIQDNATQPVHLVWRMEVASENAPLRELVLVNAQSGKISLHFNQIDATWTGAPAATVESRLKDDALQPVRVAGAPDPSLDRFVATTGTDAGNCSDSANPCATINYAIGQATVGDTIGVAVGTYTGSGTEVVALHMQVNLSGGWDATFTTQTGLSIVDGQKARYGIFVNNWKSGAGIAIIDHFAFINSTRGFYKYDGDATLKNSAVYSNTNAGIYNLRDGMYLENVTVSNNSGSGITDTGTSTITNVTISGNTGTGLSRSGTGTTTLRNTIIADNTTDCVGAITSAGYNLVKNTTGCTITAATGDQFNVDAGLGKFLPSHKYIPLLSTSLAIDAGDTCPATDQRGQSRPVGGNCDIGAYEYVTPGAAASIWIETGDEQRTRVETPYAKPLTVAVLDAQGNPVEGVDVTFTAPVSGPSVTFAGGQPTELLTTDGGGIATTSIPTASAEFGMVAVTVDALTLPQVSFTLENLNWQWYVSFATGSDANDCKTALTPCATIQTAIDKANENDTIYVEEGTYTADDGQPFVVRTNKSINILGGWNTDFTTQVGFSAVDGERKVGGISVYGYQKTVTIDHFMVMNGAVNGGVSLSSVTLTISNSAIFNNVKSGTYADGAGVYNYLGSITLNNVTISNNRTNADIGGQGGGIYSYMGSATLNNVTITNNSSKDGGGVWLGTANQPGASISVKNTILYNNHATNIGPDCYGQSNVNANNIIGDTTGCTMFSAENGNQLNVNPLLGTFIEGVGYQPLLASSPAINAGANCYGTADQRGYTRVDTCDIGAYEYAFSGIASRLVLAGGDNQRTPPLTPFANPLSVAVLDAAGSPVSGAQVVFTAPSTGASGTFPGGLTSTSITAGSDGIASVAFTANADLGSYQVVAELAGIGSVNFDLRNLAWFVRPDGDDLNDCATPSTPCATINGILLKIENGDTVNVASGVYVYTSGTIHQNYVALVEKDVILLGGWDSTFTSRDGYSIIDGENAHAGMYTAGANVTVDRFILQNGKSIGFGGGLNNGKTLTVSNSIIRNNVADSWGGGIMNSGTLTLDHVIIYNNRSGEGGGIYNAGNALTIKYSAIFSNTSDYGGGIYSRTGSSKIYNSTINGNFATQNGGGIDNDGGTTALYNVTISNNRADYGGGVYNYNSNVNSVLIKNTILALNTARLSGQNCGEEMAFGSVKSSGNSLIDNTSGCSYISGSGDKVNVNPLLGTFLPSRGYHPLLAGSPAINAGASCYGNTDQRGIARVGACDMGSYEYDPIGAATFVEIVSGDNQRTAPTFAFGKPLGVVVLDDNGSPVSNQAMTFIAPDNGPSGTFANGTNVDAPVITDAGGVAVASVFTANNQSGSYVVAATWGSLSVNFNLANVALYVEPTSGSDANDCLSALTACVSLQGAIDKAVEDDVIFAAVGEYSSSDAQVVNLTKSLILVGGWDSTFTMQTGYSTINGYGVSSGVIVPAGVMARMTRFVITNSWNNAIQKGGIHNRGTLTLSQCEISNNTSAYSGGGIYNSGILSLNECTVRKNTGNTFGGGIYNSGQINISNSVITGNVSNRMSAGAQSYGGGIYNEGSATINDTLIIENTGFLGGGIYSIGTLSLNRVSVSRNISANGGGLYVEQTATLLNTTIYGNSASGPGGGIYASGVTLTLNNATVSGNTGSSGGGIYKSGTAGKITIKNSILGNNTKTTGTGPDCSGAIISGGYNIIRSTTGCTVTSVTGDKFNVNPLLGVYLPVQGYQPLLAGSPAINAGNSTTCLKTDQRRVSRVGICDMGAYEYTTPGAPTQVTSPDWIFYHVPPNSQLAMPLQVAVLDAIGSPVGGVEVAFTAPSSGPGGVFTSTNGFTATVTTAQSGIATAPAYIANSELGSYTITASTGFGSTDFNLANLVWFVSTSGNNGDNCITPTTPCASVTGALGKPDFLSGDVIRVASGTYDLVDTNNFKVDQSTSIIGGWDAAFNAVTGVSTFHDAFDISSLYLALNVQLSNLLIEDTSDGTTTIWGIRNGETLLVKNTTIRNTATAIENYGKLTVMNSTISGNDGYTFSGEGGIYNGDIGKPINTVKVINSTITKNTGNGISNETGAGTFTLVNSIVVGNINPYGPDVDCYGAFVSGGHNIIGNIGVSLLQTSCKADWSSTDQIGITAKPILSSKVLVDTLMQDPVTGQWYHPLTLGSLAIDAGNTAPIGSGGNACPATDQLGAGRPVGVYCDIGAVEYQFNINPPADLLVTYNANHSTILPGASACSGNDATCADSDAHVVGAHQNAFSAYSKYLEWHGRNSIDGNGMQINSTVRYWNNYKNAFWNGHLLVYGDGYGFPLADDVVAHELTHGVTQYESNLFYWYQSGAINESFSDLWGEAVDQINGMGNDTASVKWLIGEDVTDLGAVRNMARPPAFNDPDSMTSTFYCKSGSCLNDNGGVHTNSGVNNKAVYLMVNGGTFGGQTVPNLEWPKVLTIYYEAQTNLLTSGSDYLDLYNSLYQACKNKIGFNGITDANCTAVRNATLAVKMNQQPTTNFNPDATYCPTGTSRVSPDLFYEDFETGTDGWTIGKLAGSSVWGLSGANARGGLASLWADDSYEKVDAYATTKGITLPAGSKPYLHFSHFFRFEAVNTSYYDGGVLEYSINNGKTWTDASALFSAGKDYAGKLVLGYGNPLQGRSAFAGDSHGFVDSRYNLTSFAGKTIRFRWRIGTDSGGSVLGWYLDEVRVYKCVSQ
jgi:Zn-dependent metalloprotease